MISFARLFFQTSGKEILYFIMDIYIAIDGDSFIKKGECEVFSSVVCIFSSYKSEQAHSWFQL